MAGLDPGSERNVASTNMKDSPRLEGRVPRLRSET
jgi:hypothetical protein